MSSTLKSDPAAMAETEASNANANANAIEGGHTDVIASYAGPSSLTVSEGTAKLALFGNLKRDPVRFEAEVKHPLRLREALAALHAVVASDYRYVPKDRTAYTAYLRMKKEAASLSLWQAQQAYFSWLSRNDPLAFLMLDPIVTVHPDRLLLEVFSKDEGTYAVLSVRRDAFEDIGETAFGVTNIDFSQALHAGVQQMRSYRRTRLSIGQHAVKLATAKAGEVIEKKIQLPDSWMRGFLQVQSSTTLPKETFQLAPVDLYNILRHLRMNGDRKGKRRGVRIELVPNQPPRLVLEPWETVVVSSAGPYKGRSAKVVRLWGRRRLMLLARFLPQTDVIEVSTLGSGMPSFWVLRGEGMTLTLGLTGFTAANWSQAVSFDLLLPRKTQTGKPLETVVKHLSTRWLAKSSELSEATGLKGEALFETLQNGCQQGQLMYDLAEDVYRLRPLVDVPLDFSRLEYRNSAEKTAHDLLVRRGGVSIVSENRIALTGLELTGKVVVREDDRDYRPQLLINEEGQVVKAECTCPLFRKQGLKQGPCPHLVALRLAYAERAAQRARGEGSDSLITETRTFSKRDPQGEDVYQVTLDRQKLKVRWGRAGEAMRLQTLKFDTPDLARAAYFARLGDLNQRGFLDATMG